jgi:H/ACA ribonucleoprotein complex subunit 2
LAADVSPVDVISHFPILCEKAKVPYSFIRSREALGTSSQTKRPTSVVMLLKPDEDNKYRESFDKLVEVLRQINPYIK